MAVIKQESRPEAPASVEAPSFWNVIDMVTFWLVKVFVSPAQLRTLIGREIVGIAPHESGGGRSVPVYAKDSEDRTVWLNKAFTFEVPKRVGIYDLSGRGFDQDTSELHIESSQVQVFKNAAGELELKRLGYGEMVEHFGGARLTRGADGTLNSVTAEATSI